MKRFIRLSIVSLLGILFCFPLMAHADSDCTHDWYDTEEYKYVDGTYHARVYECYNCGDTKIGPKAKHHWELDYLSTFSGKATLTKKGSVEFECTQCGSWTERMLPWKFGTDYSVTYDVNDHSNIYRNSKSITVTLDRAVKGAVVKVKIGKKTYSAKVKTKKKVKVKIKKPKKYAQKITIKVYYKGRLIGIDACDDGIENWDRVLYGKNIKRGYSKKKVRYCYNWGPPDDTASSSGGWSYWYYNNGSAITFKNGKVYRWYKYN